MLYFSVYKQYIEAFIFIECYIALIATREIYIFHNAVIGWHFNILKEIRSVTMNIFRKKIFSFKIVCKNRIKLCFHNKNAQYS